MESAPMTSDERTIEAGFDIDAWDEVTYDDPVD